MQVVPDEQYADLLVLPYVSGGFPEKDGGVDCFTSWIILLERNGYSLDRTGWAPTAHPDVLDDPEAVGRLIGQGELDGPWCKIDPLDIAPLDVVLMDPEGIGKATHLATYLGRNRVLNVSRQHGTQVLRLSVLTRAAKVVGYRRLLHPQKTGTLEAPTMPQDGPQSGSVDPVAEAVQDAVVAARGGIPAVLLDTVRVHLSLDPLGAPHSRIQREIPYREGMTIQDVAPTGEGWDDWPGTVVAVATGPSSLLVEEADWRDAVKLPQEWDQIDLERGGNVVFMRLPGGTEVVLLIIGLVISLVSTILSFVLTPSLDTPEQKKVRNSPTFDLSGIQNTAQPGLPIPVVYGEHRVGGNIISAFLSVDGQLRTQLNVIVCVSQGEVEAIGGLTDDVGALTSPTGSAALSTGLTGDQIPDTIQIDGNPAGQFECEVFLRHGSNNQEPITPLAFDAQTIPYDKTLFLDTPFVHVTANEITQFALLITFPRGLYAINSGGSVVSRSVDFRARYRLIPTPGDPNPAWTDLGAATVTNARRGQFSTSLNTVPIPRGRYEIEITREVLDWPETGNAESQSVLFGVNEYAEGVQSFPGMALVGYRLTATDQISGGLPNFTHLVKGVKVWVPDEPLNEAAPTFGGPNQEKQWSDVPAWCLLDMVLNPVYGMARGAEIALDNVDLQSLIDWKTLTETLVSDGRGGTVKRASFNMVYDQETTAWDAVVAMTVAQWGRPLMVGDKITIVPEEAQSISFVFNMTNMRDFTLRYVGRNVKPNRVEVQFFNEEDNYEGDVIERPINVQLDVQSPDKKEQALGVGITRPYQAARYSQFRYNHGQRRRFAEWTSGLETLGIIPGDVVGVSHEAAEWGEGGRLTADAPSTTQITIPYEVTLGSNPRVLFQSSTTDIVYERIISAAAATYPAGTTFTVTVAWDSSDQPKDGDKVTVGEADEYFTLFRILTVNIEQGMRRSFSAVEYVAADYDDDPGDVPTATEFIPRGTDMPEAAQFVQVEDVKVVNGDGSSFDELRVYFKATRDWEKAEVWYRSLPDDADAFGSDDDATWQLAGMSSEGILVWGHNLSVGTVVEVSVCPLAPRGTRRAPRRGVRVLHEIIGRTATRPAGPAEYQHEQAGTESWIFRGVKPADKDFAGFRVVEGQSRIGGRVLVDCNPSKEVYMPQLGAGLQAALATSVNRSGVASFEGVDLGMNESAILNTDHSVDQQTNEHSSWSGTKTNTQVDGGTSRLELAAGQLTGTYETGTISLSKGASATSVRLLARLFTELEDVALPLDHAMFKLNSQQAQVPLDQQFYYGTELDEVVHLDDMTFALDSDYADLWTGKARPDVFRDSVALLEFRTSQNGGVDFTEWDEFVPCVRTLNAVQFRLTLNRACELYNPQVIQMTTYLILLS